MKKLFAFTLAEVLITLAIIGIVAALTIPTLINNYQKKQYVTGLQKSISQISQTFKLILANEGVENLSQTSVFHAIYDNGDANSMHGDQSKFVAELNKYMKISKACFNLDYDEPNPGCTYPVYKDLLGNNNDDGYKMYNRVKLYMPDGMVYFIRAIKEADQHIIARIEVDVNGDKGPNILGRDWFSYVLQDDGQVLLPGTKYLQDNEEYNYYHTHWSDDSVIDTCSAGGYCAARIFEQGWKMDY